jgi:hypothetical protein
MCFHTPKFLSLNEKAKSFNQILRVRRKVLFLCIRYFLLGYKLLKSKIFWIALFLLMFIPMAITFAFADDYIRILRIALSSLRYRSADLILSDILFFEAGFFLVLGAMFAGTVLYLSWSPGWMALFVDPVFHWRLVKKVREIPAALLLGFLVMGIGIIYILVAVTVTL